MNTRDMTCGDALFHSASGTDVKFMKVDGDINYVKFPDGHVGAYRSSEFTASNVPRALSEQIGDRATKASSADEDGDTLRERLVNKTVALASLRTESDDLKRCGISDCRKMILDLRAGQIEEELHTVAELMAKAPTTPTLRKSAGGFSKGDRVKVIGSRLGGDWFGRIGTVMSSSHGGRTAVLASNGFMALVPTEELALA